MTLQKAMKMVGIFYMTTLPFLVMRLLQLELVSNDGLLGRFFFWDPGNIVYEVVLMGMTFIWGYFLYKASEKPAENGLFVDMTIWATAFHGMAMGVYAIVHANEAWHLAGDVPFLLISACLLYIAKTKQVID